MAPVLPEARAFSGGATCFPLALRLSLRATRIPRVCRPVAEASLIPVFNRHLEKGEEHTMAKATKSGAGKGPPPVAAQVIKKALAARKKADEAMEKAHLKVFAAKLIVQIAKAADIKPPSMEVRKATIEHARAKAAAAKARAQALAAAFRKKVEARIAAA